MISLVPLAILLADLPADSSRHLTPLASEIRLELRMQPGQSVVGDPVSLHIVATSAAARPVTAILQLNPLLANVVIEYRNGAASFQTIELFNKHAEFSSLSPPTVIRPGQAIEHIETIAVTTPYDRPFRYLLAEPGTYEFRATLRDTPNDPNGVVVSETLSVPVLPVPSGEATAFSAFTPELARFATFSPLLSLVPPGLPEAAEAFITSYPSSRYAVNAREGLRRYLVSFIQRGAATDAQKALYDRLFGEEASGVPPTLSLSGVPILLWPPNRRLIPITIQVTASDDSGTLPTVRLVSIACDDACDPERDIVEAEFGTDDCAFKLRADRTGGGKGRTYTITYEATDSAGNKATAITTVSVPHDQRKK